MPSIGTRSFATCSASWSGRPSVSAYLATLSALNRNVRLFLITPIAVGLSYYGFFLVLFNLYLLRLGYGPRFIGALTASGPLAFIVVSLPAGALSRLWGSRRLLLVGIGLYIVSFGLLPFADLLPAAWQAPWLFGFYVLAFLGGAFYWPNSEIYMMTVTRSAERSLVFSLRQALLPLAGFAGSLVAGALPRLIAAWLDTSLDDPAPFRYALLLSSVVYLPAFCAMLATDRAPVRAHESAAIEPVTTSLVPLLSGTLITLIGIEVVWKGGNSGPINFFNVYLDSGLGLATAAVGMVIAFGQLFAAAAALATPLLTARYGLRQTVLLSLVGLGASLLLIAGPPNWVAAAIGYVGLRSWTAISSSAIAVYRMELVGAQQWGLLSGGAVAGQGIGESGMLLAGGFIIAGAGFGAFFFAAALMIGLSAVAYGTYFRHTTAGRFI